MKFSVPVHLGDDALASEDPSFIKIDVEGFETSVILGLIKIIERCSPIIVTEVSASHLERAGSSVEKLKSVMERLGYCGFKLTLRKINRRYDWCLADFDPSKSDYDAVWLNESVAQQRLIAERRIHGDDH